MFSSAERINSTGEDVQASTEKTPIRRHAFFRGTYAPNGIHQS